MSGAGEDGSVLPLDLAQRLRAAGLVWKPAPGDRFAVPDRDLDDEVFVLSNMTIEVHEAPEGTLIGFNGTTEWALDDLDKDEAVWLPREDQLREHLGGAFHRLERVGAAYRVVLGTAGDEIADFTADTAEAAYGHAVLWLLAG
jgi:hypothetical protein